MSHFPVSLHLTSLCISPALVSARTQRQQGIALYPTPDPPPDGSSPLSAFAVCDEIVLPAPTGAPTSAPRRRWLSYPGLFARGGLDVMTERLLGALPPSAKHARVLDFACGSGVIGAALLAREPSLRLVSLGKPFP